MSSSVQLSTRPVSWKEVAPGPISTDVIPQLPKLPVPELGATLSRLKESLKPIAWSADEYSSVAKAIDDFASGRGQELHSRLLQRAKEKEHWLETWWDDAGYLGYRDSVVIYVSYYYGFDAHPAHLKQTPAARAAGITRAALQFRQRLKRGLTPESTKEGPLCMDTYRWMFDCCRVPGPQGLDWSVSYAKPGDLGDSGHVIVFRKNRAWKLETFQDGRMLSTGELEEKIQYIYDNTTQGYPGVNVLTASNRDVWARDYKELSSSPINSQIIRDIHSAAFTISLDDAQPSTPETFSRSLWHGELSADGVPVGLHNRWVDKPVQFIVFDNAKAGIMGEHSVMDGTPTVRLCDELLDALQDPSFDHGRVPTSPTINPTPLDWEVSDQTATAISSADKAVKELIDSQELNFFLTSYGKATIKKFGVSPDSWAQMIIQLAYKRLIGNEKRVGGTYEAATTRKFHKGRTEAIRVVTSASDAWVASMDDAEVDTTEKKRLFGEAAKKHISLAREAGNASGVDRHLFGLKKLVREGEETPGLFTHPVFTRSSYWVLSTSAIFSKHFPVYGWGEVVPDGYGVAYMTGYDDRIQYTITSRREMPNAEFVRQIAKAADDMHELYQANDGKSRL